MKKNEPGPAVRVVRGELILDGEALADVLRAVLAKGADVRFRARGSSMSPFIRDGDLVTIRPRGTGRLGPGDVVAFVLPRTAKIAVHRIVAAAPPGYVIKGDSLPEADGLVPGDSILGVVRAIVRNGRKVRPGIGRGRRLVAWLSRTKALDRGLSAARAAKRLTGRRKPA